MKGRTKTWAVAAAILCVFLFLSILCLAWMDQEPTVAGQTVSHWVKELGIGPYERTVIAKEHLKDGGPDVVHYLLDALEEPSRSKQAWRDRYHTLWAKLRDPPRRWLPVPQTGRFDRRELITALSELAPESSEVVSVLVEEVGNGEQSIRFVATRALGRMRVEVDDKVLPALSNTLTNDVASNVRSAAGYSLGDMGEVARAAVPALIIASKDTGSDVRWTAAKALGNLGAGSQEAVAALKASLDDPDVVVRSYAAQAHFKLTGEPEPAVSVFVAMLQDSESDERGTVASVLAKIGPAAESAIPTLRELVVRRDLDELPVTLFSAHALWSISGETELPLAALLHVVKHGERYHLIRASEFLGNLGEAASPAVKELIRLASVRDLSIRRGAIIALGKVGKAAEEAVPALKQIGQDDPVPSVREAALESMEKIRIANHEVQGVLDHAN